MALTGHKRQREGGGDDAASGAGARIDTGADDPPVHELSACKQALWSMVHPTFLACVVCLGHDVSSLTSFVDIMQSDMSL